jgi:hypothetical protein
MTTRELSFAVLAALAAAGGVYVLDDKGANEQVKLVADASTKTEITGAAADAVLFDDGGQPRAFTDGDTVTCRAGGYLDGVYRTDVEWCSDGKGQTWTRAAKGAETIQIVGGKAYSTAAP